MHLKRVIPCLDVDAGRVVKGVQFVDLRDAGDPVELARATTPRAPTSWCSSTSPPADERATSSTSSRRTADAVFMPLTSAAASARSTTPGGARAGADKVSINTAAVAATRADRQLAGRSARSAWCWRSTPSRAGGGGWEVFIRRARPPPGSTWSLGPRGDRAGGRRDPAHQHGPRRHQGRLRPGADRAVRRGRRAGDRQRRRRQARAPDRRGEAGADAVLLASIFHFGQHTVGEVKASARGRLACPSGSTEPAARLSRARPAPRTRTHNRPARSAGA